LSGDVEEVVSVDEAELTALFERLGAPNPAGWAHSQIKEGIPQLHRYLFLRQAWRGTVQEGDNLWIEEMLHVPTGGPGGAIVGALKRALDCGASKEDLTTIVRVMQWSTLHRFCYLLSDPGDLEPEVAHIEWSLFQTDEGLPLVAIGGLHESVLETDPTGREMKPLSL
jgi:hypothetical protein